MSSLDDGLAWFKNKINKIEKSFSSVNKEGYSGILGPSNIDSINSAEDMNTSVMTGSLNSTISTYAETSEALKSKTNRYLNSIKSTEGRNYNVFINSAAGIDKFADTRDNIQCSTSAILTNGGLNDAGDLFYGAYPDNFANVDDAKNACKLWAADSSVPSFAVSKSADNQKFTCYTGTLKGNPAQYSVPQVGMMLATSRNATRGGLFYDGTIGVYNDIPSQIVEDPTNPKNIQLMQGNEGNGGTVPQGYSVCDKWIGGALKSSSISATLGKNCSGLSKPPFSARYITIKGNARGEHIQISQVAVFTYNETSGVITNVAPQGSVSNGKINNLSWIYANIRYSIDGYQGARNYPYIYHSYGESPNNFWQLDLGQDYPIFKVVYYNRADCCQSRAIGMTLSLENGARTKIVKKIVSSASLVQPFTIAEADSVAETPPFTKPHLDNIGTVSFTWDDSDKYAKSKGGRLATEAELINYITKNGGGNLVPTDQWAAVTDGWRGQKDYIQIGTRSGGVGASHLLYYGTANWWYSAAGNPLYAKWVFWMGPD
jgi:hypothetical protein